MRAVFSGVHFFDQCVILLFGGFKAERIRAAFISHAHQLLPTAPQETTFRQIFAEAQQVSLVITVSESRYDLAVHVLGNFGCVLD